MSTVPASLLERLRQPESKYPPVGDVVLAVGASLMVGLWGDLLVGRSDAPWQEALGVIATLTFTMALILRRRAPMIMLGLLTASGIAQLVLFATPSPALIVVPIASYSMARWVTGHQARAVIWVGLAASLLGPLRWTMGQTFPSNLTSLILLFFVCSSSVVAPYLLGRRLQESEQAERDRALAGMQRYEAELARREQAARITEAQVRADIARELHDVVAHSLSVIIVQADGGRRLAAKRPEAAGEALDTIAETGREALTEMRRIVGVLRNDPDQPGADYVPNPGLADLPGMVAKAGERVRLVTTGVPPIVPPTLGLTVFRVAQEAVTNALKHAGPSATITVSIDYLPTEIWLTICDDGVGAQAASDGLGHGLRGMAERVISMGGRLSTGPRPEGGYQVRAWLPLPVGQPPHLGPGRWLPPTAPVGTRPPNGPNRPTAP